MEIPHANEIQKVIENRQNSEDSAILKKTDNYKKKLEKASLIYYNNIMNAVQNAIRYMSEKGKQNYIKLQNEDFQLPIDWGEDKKICWHWMHYGFIRKGWRSRDTSAWNRFNIERPFKKAQKELEEKGWYLVDHSNPERSFGVYIYLYTYPPEKLPLWHDLN
tara:strand:- start:177 stop:662 length:486 start_codon:yes stop_codon:yes gene_type:complete